MIQKINVVGMTCDHCIKAVTEEVMNIDGVQSVQVDLDSGVVAIDASHEISRDLLLEAVDEAGYELGE